MRTFNPIRFADKETAAFASTLKQRVDEYFKQNNLEKDGNLVMYSKTFFMFALHFIPYAFIVSDIFTGTLWYYLMWIISGVGLAGIGLSVMHDANHGAYSRNQKINKLMCLSLNIVGGHALNWRIQHNVLYHTYTNVHGLDEDINPAKVLRFSPYAPKFKFHRFQHIYATFLYALMTFNWILVKDFKRLKQYDEMGFLKAQKTTYKKELFYVILTKVMYLSYMLLVPILLTDATVGQVLLGFLSYHFVAGLILSMVFQPAHVIEHTLYPLPNEKGVVEKNWFAHQMLTSANFSENNKLLTWYVGGLNYQIEHHLFPSICHVHYPKIAPIVKQTAKEFGLPYHGGMSFSEAIILHFKMLKKLGQ
jgi:linoleoyl-CoA desaturase